MWYVCRTSPDLGGTESDIFPESFASSAQRGAASMAHEVFRCQYISQHPSHPTQPVLYCCPSRYIGSYYLFSQHQARRIPLPRGASFAGEKTNGEGQDGEAMEGHALAGWKIDKDCGMSWNHVISTQQ